jgi:hypothetical protein
LWLCVPSPVAAVCRRRRYCDGGSFTGNRSEPVDAGGRLIHFRGRAILEYTMRALLEVGLSTATHIVLGGQSAGALSVLLHQRWMVAALPSTAHVSLVLDGGVFADCESYWQPGVHAFRER